MSYTVKHIQRLHADRHTHTLLRDTPSHTLTVITTVCIMERHMLVLHTKRYPDIHRGTLILQGSQIPRHIRYRDLLVTITHKYRCTLTPILKQGHTPSLPTATSHWSL